MTSELWQRLREARKFANKTQLDMAKAAGVTRSGYAFWETPDADSRTRPNSDQIVALCKLTKVPVDWLLDDKANVSDIWRDGGPATVVREREQPPPSSNPDRVQQRFWAAVEYIVTSRDPSRDSAFGQVVRAGAIELQADYLWQNTLAVFTRSAGDSELLQTISYTLTVARAARMREPLLLVLVRSDEPPSEAMVESARRFLGVQITAVETPEKAAALLLR